MEFTKKICFIGAIITFILAIYIITNRYNTLNRVVIQKYSFKKFTRDSSNAFKSADTTCPNGNDSECKQDQHCVDGTCRIGRAGSTCRKSGDCDKGSNCSSNGKCVKD